MLYFPINVINVTRQSLPSISNKLSPIPPFNFILFSPSDCLPHLSLLLTVLTSPALSFYSPSFLTSCRLYARILLSLSTYLSSVSFIPARASHSCHHSHPFTRTLLFLSYTSPSFPTLSILHSLFMNLILHIIRLSLLLIPRLHLILYSSLPIFPRQQ